MHVKVANHENAQMFGQTSRAQKYIISQC